MDGKPKDPAEERRRHRRLALIREIEYEGKRGKVQRRLADISAGGMFIDTPEPLRPGSKITVRVRLPDSEEPVVATAEVKYTQDGVGMGVEFLDLKPEDREKIEKLVEKFYSIMPPGQELPYKKSSRIIVNVPVTIKGTEGDGTGFMDNATIVSLSKNGASLLTDRNLEVGMTLFLYTANGLEFKSSIVWIGNKVASGTKREVRIQCRDLAQALGFNLL